MYFLLLRVLFFVVSYVKIFYRVPKSFTVKLYLETPLRLMKLKKGFFLVQVGTMQELLQKIVTIT